MEIIDRAIIVRLDKFKENDALVTLFTREHGLVKGIAKRAFTSKHRGTYQLGNYVDMVWNARLEEHLGNVQCELFWYSGSIALKERQSCYMMQSMCALLLLAMQERDAHPVLYKAIDKVTEAMHFKPEAMMADYVRYEFLLLQEAGFGLGLDCCIATGTTENLSYISPKSGCAVSAEAGKPYADKLFPFPQFILQEMHWIASEDDVRLGLEITEHFFRKWMLPTLDRPMPPIRERLVNTMKEPETTSSVSPIGRGRILS